MFKQFKEKRARLQRYTAVGLPAVIIGGWLYPPLGVFTSYLHVRCNRDSLLQGEGMV